MNKTELAALLNGREYRHEISDGIDTKAKAAGLVIVFGASDDLMEFRGAINDEVGAFDGTTAYLTTAGLLQNDCENESCPHFAKLKLAAKTIDAVWDADGYSWIYRTNIPHATFGILEDSETYCRGIVFSLAMLEPDFSDI